MKGKHAGVSKYTACGIVNHSLFFPLESVGECLYTYPDRLLLGCACYNRWLLMLNFNHKRYWEYLAFLCIKHFSCLHLVGVGPGPREAL